MALPGPRIELLAAKNAVLYRSRPQFPLARQSRSSLLEHLLDMEVVGGSIPLATTNSLTDLPAATRDLRRNCARVRYGHDSSQVYFLVHEIFEGHGTCHRTARDILRRLAGDPRVGDHR